MNTGHFANTPAILRPYDHSDDSSNSAILKTTRIYEHNATPFPGHPRPYDPLVATMVLSAGETIPSLNLANFDAEEIVASYCLPFEGNLHTPRRLDCSYPYPFQRLFCHERSNGLEAIDLMNDLSEADKAITRKFSHPGYRKVGNEKRRVIELLDVTMADGKIWIWENDERGRISVNRTVLDSETTLADDTIEVSDSDVSLDRGCHIYHLTNSTILRDFESSVDLYDLNKEVSVSGGSDVGADRFSVHAVSDFGYFPNSSNWPIRIGSTRWNRIYFLFGGENEISRLLSSSSIRHVTCATFLSEFHAVIGGYTKKGINRWKSYIEYYDLRKDGKIASFRSGIYKPSSFARHPFDSNRCLFTVEQLKSIVFNPINSCKQIQLDGSSPSFDLTSRSFLSDSYGIEGLRVKQVLTLNEPFNFSSGGGGFSIPREGSLFFYVNVEQKNNDDDEDLFLFENEEINVDCSDYPPFCCFVDFDSDSDFDSGVSGILFFDENLQISGKVKFTEFLKWKDVDLLNKGYAIHRSKEIIAIYDRTHRALILVVNRQIVFHGRTPRKMFKQFGFLQNSIAIRFGKQMETCLYDLLPQNDKLVLIDVIPDPDQVDPLNAFGTDTETNSLFFVVSDRLVEYYVTSNHELEFLRDWEICSSGKVVELEVTSCYVKLVSFEDGFRSTSFVFRSLLNDGFDYQIWNSECLGEHSTFHSYVVNDHDALAFEISPSEVLPLTIPIPGEEIIGQTAKRKMFVVSDSRCLVPNLCVIPKMSIPRQLPNRVMAPCFPKFNPSKKAQWLCYRNRSLQLCSSDNEVLKTVVSQRCYSISLFGTSNKLGYDPILFSPSISMVIGFLAVPIARKSDEISNEEWKLECQVEFDQMMNLLAVSIINPTMIPENLKIGGFVAFNEYRFEDIDTKQVESVLIGDDLVAVKPLKDDRFWVTTRSICLDQRIPLHEAAEEEVEEVNEFVGFNMEEDNLRCKVIESQLLAGVRFEMDPDELLQKTVDSLSFELDESYGVLGVGKFLNSLSVTTARMKPLNRDHPWVSAEILDDDIRSAASDLKGSEFSSKSMPREMATYYLCRSVCGDVRQVPERFEIKLCASRLNDGARLPVVTRTLGSVGRFLGLKGASFGLVHVYPTVGPLRIHWDTSSEVTLTLEKRQNVVIRLKLHEFVCENESQQIELFGLFEKLAHYIDHCNENVSYDMQGDRKPNHHNCQSFSLLVLKILMGGFKKHVPTAVYEYLTKTLPSLIAADESVRRLNLKKIQIGDFRFGQLFPGVVDRVSALGTGCQVQKTRFTRKLNWISFSTSAEVRLFMDLLEKRYCDFRFLFPGEWRLLGGFSAEKNEGKEESGLRKSEVIRHVVAPFFDRKRWLHFW